MKHSNHEEEQEQSICAYVVFTNEDGTVMSVDLFKDYSKAADFFDRQVKKELFADGRKRVQERYKEYDGTYLGHYSQYFFWFFFCCWRGHFRLGYLPDTRQPLPLGKVI